MSEVNRSRSCEKCATGNGLVRNHIDCEKLGKLRCLIEGQVGCGAEAIANICRHYVPKPKLSAVEKAWEEYRKTVRVEVSEWTQRKKDFFAGHTAGDKDGFERGLKAASARVRELLRQRDKTSPLWIWDLATEIDERKEAE